MKEILNYLHRERLGYDEATFIYELHENQIFDERLFKKFLDNVLVFLDEYENYSEESVFLQIKEEVLFTVEYIIASFENHYSEDDLFVIKNMEDFTSIYITKSILELREIRQVLLSK